jgi:hypothetical protein
MELGERKVLYVRTKYRLQYPTFVFRLEKTRFEQQTRIACQQNAVATRQDNVDKNYRIPRFKTHGSRDGCTTIETKTHRHETCNSKTNTSRLRLRRDGPFNRIRKAVAIANRGALFS